MARRDYLRNKNKLAFHSEHRYMPVKGGLSAPLKKTKTHKKNTENLICLVNFNWCRSTFSKIVAILAVFTDILFKRRPKR